MTAPAVHYSDDPRTDINRARSRLATLHQGKSRGRIPDADAVVDAKRTLNEMKLAKAIRDLVDEAPPLTSQQRDRLATLLRGDR